MKQAILESNIKTSKSIILADLFKNKQFSTKVSKSYKNRVTKIVSQFYKYSFKSNSISLII